MKTVVLGKDSEVVFKRVDLTENIAERLTGLLGRDHYSEECAMWIKPCSSVHTFFMRFSIDVIFLDRDMNIINIRRNVQPWMCVCGPRGSFSVVETLAGATDESLLTVGDRLRCL